MKRNTIFCKHYQAMVNHDVCKVNIPYADFKGLSFDQKPCFLKPGESQRPGCDKAEFPTEAELAVEEKEATERFANIMKAREAIVKNIGKPWKPGMEAVGGKMKCPICEGGELRYSRAGINGHIHARCSTKDCVSWME